MVELGSRKKIAKFGRGVRETLLAAAMPIGCLRLHSLRAGLNLRFQDFKYATCLDAQSLTIHIRSLVRKMANRSQRSHLPCQDVVREIVVIQASMDDHWLICYGADMVEVLAYGLRGTLGTNSARAVKPQVVRRSLRLAFRRGELNKSGLGRDLREWSDRNPGFYILGPE